VQHIGDLNEQLAHIPLDASPKKAISVGITLTRPPTVIYVQWVASPMSKGRFELAIASVKTGLAAQETAEGPVGAPYLDEG